MKARSEIIDGIRKRLAVESTEYMVLDRSAVQSIVEEFDYKRLLLAYMDAVWASDQDDHLNPPCTSYLDSLTQSELAELKTLMAIAKNRKPYRGIEELMR